MLFEFLVKRIRDELVAFGVVVRLQLGDVDVNGRSLGAIFVGVQRNHPVARCDPRHPVQRGLEDGSQLVVVRLRDRVVSMVVALGTADAQSQQTR